MRQARHWGSLASAIAQSAQPHAHAHSHTPRDHSLQAPSPRDPSPAPIVPPHNPHTSLSFSRPTQPRISSPFSPASREPRSSIINQQSSLGDLPYHASREPLRDRPLGFSRTPGPVCTDQASVAALWLLWLVTEQYHELADAAAGLRISLVE